jgi:hypothetical protein
VPQAPTHASLLAASLRADALAHAADDDRSEVAA